MFCKKIKIYSYVLFCLSFTCSSFDAVVDCKSKQNPVNGSLLGCHDSFDSLMINGILIDTFNLADYVKNYSKQDSIVEDYYYFGKSSIFYYEGELRAVEVYDDNIMFDNIVSINSDIEYLIDRFPCSYS